MTLAIYLGIINNQKDERPTSHSNGSEKVEKPKHNPLFFPRHSSGKAILRPKMSLGEEHGTNQELGIKMYE